MDITSSIVFGGIDILFEIVLLFALGLSAYGILINYKLYKQSVERNENISEAYQKGQNDATRRVRPTSNQFADTDLELAYVEGYASVWFRPPVDNIDKM